MDYLEIRHKATTGDVLGVMGSGFFSKVIKFLTKEDFSHVAMLIWHGTGLWVYEFVEGRGYQCMPASQWMEIRAGQTIFYGKAPLIVRAKPADVIKSAGSFRVGRGKTHYGYLSLIKVWLSQIFKRKIHTHFMVCSTFIQHVWRDCGFDHSKTADPGDIMSICSAYGELKPVDTKQS